MKIPDSQTGYGFIRGLKDINVLPNLPVKKPGPNEILLKIEVAGLCHSDHHILLEQSPLNPDPMVMGHEICGSIAQVGSELKDNENYAIGSRHTIFILNSCAVCIHCKKGRDNLCLEGRFDAFGITLDGGFQEYLLVKNPRALVPIPDGVSYEAAASATDAILTPFHAIMKVRERLGPATKVLVLGAGGLGLNAIQILNVFGCKITCVDKKPEVRDIVKNFGASEFYTDFDDIEDPQETFDLSFDFIGIPESVACSVQYIAAGGKIVMVGMGRLKAVLPIYDLCRREVEVIFNIGGTSVEQAEILQWLKEKKLRPIVETKPMSSLPEYMEKLTKNQLTGRVVFKPKL